MSKDDISYSKIHKFLELLEDSNPEFLYSNGRKTQEIDGSEDKRYNKIAEVIQDNLQHSKKCKIIGLSGSFGSGKTTVCRILEKNLKNIKSEENSENDRYFVFLYDLWKHQSEPLKLSLLENLTNELIDRNLLRDCDDHFSNQIDDSPKRKLRNWLLDKNIGVEYSYQYDFEIKSICYVVIFSMFADIFADIVMEKWPQFVGVLLVLAAIIVSVYNTRSTKEHFRKDFFNKDLSVADFQYWLQKITETLISDTDIVIVLDNVDRLPPQNVKDLFSSVHEIFNQFSPHEENSNNDTRKLHVLIPFDYAQICRVFNETKTDDSEIQGGDLSINNQNTRNSRAFDIINKTFSVVYEIPHTDTNAIDNFFSKILKEIVKTISEISVKLNSTEAASNVKDKAANCEDRRLPKLDVKGVVNNLRSIFYYFTRDEFRTIRNIKSFSRNIISCFLQFSKRNSDISQFPLQYVGYYAINIEFFSRYSFSESLSKIGIDNWKKVSFGMYDDKDESEARFKFLRIMAGLYYQCDPDFSSGELYKRTLKDVFTTGDISLLPDLFMKEQLLNAELTGVASDLFSNEDSFARSSDNIISYIQSDYFDPDKHTYIFEQIIRMMPKEFASEIKTKIELCLTLAEKIVDEDIRKRLVREAIDTFNVLSDKKDSSCREIFNDSLDIIFTSINLIGLSEVNLPTITIGTDDLGNLEKFISSSYENYCVYRNILEKISFDIINGDKEQLFSFIDKMSVTKSTKEFMRVLFANKGVESLYGNYKVADFVKFCSSKFAERIRQLGTISRDDDQKSLSFLSVFFKYLFITNFSNTFESESSLEEYEIIIRELGQRDFSFKNTKEGECEYISPFIKFVMSNPSFDNLYLPLISRKTFMNSKGIIPDNGDRNILSLIHDALKASRNYIKTGTRLGHNLSQQTLLDRSKELLNYVTMIFKGNTKEARRCLDKNEP